MSTVTTRPDIALIIGSTHSVRFADVPARWMLGQAQARGDLEVGQVNLRDIDLPLFDELASNAFVPSQNSEAIRWQQTIARFDGFIFVVAEYNRSLTGAQERTRPSLCRVEPTVLAAVCNEPIRAIEHNLLPSANTACTSLLGRPRQRSRSTRPLSACVSRTSPNGRRSPSIRRAMFPQSSFGVLRIAISPSVTRSI